MSSRPAKSVSSKSKDAVAASTTKESLALNSTNIHNWVSANLNLFLIGLIHSLSLHKTLPILVNDRQSAILTLQILGTNTGLLLGSIYFFSSAMGPILNQIKQIISPPEATELMPEGGSDQFVWVMYQSLWLLPICGLCYGCSMAWYQDLADSTYRYLQGMPKSASLTKSVGNALYGTLVWASAFLQVKILTLIIPIVCDKLASIVDVFFLGLNVSLNLPVTAGTDSAVSLISSIVLGIKHSILLWVHVASFASKLAGLALLCLMYGWYGFDPKWIAAGLDPDERFSILEKHWAYFMGFGVAFVVLMENTSFFVGYGVFLGLFPFSIMLGSTCDFAEPYAQYAGEKDAAAVQPMPIFKVAQKWTLLAIKYINKSAYQPKKSFVKPPSAAEKNLKSKVPPTSAAGTSHLSEKASKKYK
jgi:hypothetical protein